MDTDVIVVKPLDQLHNVVGFAQNDKLVNNAVLIFDKGNSFLADCINEYFSTFKTEVWGFNGPQLLTRVLKREPYNTCLDRAKKEQKGEKQASTVSSHILGAKNCPVSILKEEAFYPMRWYDVVETCFKDQLNTSQVKATIEASSYIVHTNGKVSTEYFQNKLPL